MKTFWAIKWPGWQASTAINMSDTDEFIVHSLARIPLLFPTRKLARKYIGDFYSHVKLRAQLKKPPYNLKMPVAVKVRVEEVG